MTYTLGFLDGQAGELPRSSEVEYMRGYNLGRFTLAQRQQPDGR